MFMQPHKDFEFNLRELAGSMGDFGTLFPLAIGYIVVCGLDPAGLFIWLGLVNIATGLVYRLPMPVEPKKVVAVAAFPMPLVGAMMLLVGIELAKIVRGLKGWGLRLALFTAALSALTNMAVGFGAGLAAAYLVRWWKRRGMLPCACSRPRGALQGV
jgi:hypothetical protein